MSRKVLKSLSVILAVLCIVVSFTACVQNGGSAGSSADTSGNTAKDSGKTTTIKFASWAQRGDTQDSDWIYRFEKKYPNLKIDYIAVTEGDYSQKLTAMIAAKTAPDVILAWECDIGRFAEGKAIIPLDDYIGKTTEFSTDDLVSAVANFNKPLGATYGIPWCMAAEILYYNKDMFDEAGLEYPSNDWTWQDFENDAKALTKVEDGKTVQWGVDAISFQGIWYSTFGTAGDKIIDENGVLTLGEGAKKALQWQYDLTNTLNVCPPPAASGTNAVDLFSAGKAAMTRAGNWMIQTYRPLEFNWDIAPLPQDERQYTTLHTGMLTLNADSKIKDDAWRFIEYTMSDEGQEIICKMGTNPSARKSITEKGFYRAGGENGPTNWSALDESIAFGQFDYVRANSGVTNTFAVNSFNAVMMGQKDVETAIREINEEAARVAAE